MKWKAIKDNTHGITAKYDEQLEAYIKWDGCCEIYIKNNKDDDADHIHLCDIPRFISRLKELEEFRVEYFGKQGTLL